jgi:hypothetical protein
LADTQDYYKQRIMLFILGSNVGFFLLVSCIVLGFTRIITQPIKRLTQLTTELKQATDLESKKLVIDKVKSDMIFKEIHAAREELEESLMDVKQVKK